MTDLAGKFAALESQLSSQQTALLGAIATATDALDAIHGHIEDLVTDTRTSRDYLARLVLAIAPSGEALPSDAKSSVAWSVYRTMDATAPSWPRETSQPVQPSIESIRTLLTASLGVSSGDSVLSLLTTILSNLPEPIDTELASILADIDTLITLEHQEMSLNDPAIVDPSHTCETPFVSEPPVVTDTAYAGRVFVRWPDLSSVGVSFTDTLSLTATAVEISPESTWSGFSLFVGSKTAQTYSEDPTRTGEWPTNEWRDLGEAQGFPLAISVPIGNDARAYLCAPAGSGGLTECTTFDSIGVSFDPPGIPSVQQGIAWSVTIFGDAADFTAPGQSFTASVRAFLIGDWGGYTLESAQSGVFVIMGGDTPNHELTPNVVYTIPDGTAFLRLSTGSEATFSVEMCPPGS